MSFFKILLASSSTEEGHASQQLRPGVGMMLELDLTPELVAQITLSIWLATWMITEWLRKKDFEVSYFVVIRAGWPWSFQFAKA